jgi:uncharacterized protein YegL
VLHCRGINEFLANMHLVYKDDHGQINMTDFEKWVTEKLSQQSQSVIVLDDAPAVIVTLCS